MIKLSEKEKENALKERDKVLEEKEKALGEKDKVLEEKDKALKQKDKVLEEAQERLRQQKEESIKQLILYTAFSDEKIAAIQAVETEYVAELRRKIDAE